MLGCHLQSFVLHCCVFKGLILNGVHLAWFMGASTYCYLLVFLLFWFSILIRMIGLHSFLVYDCCFLLSGFVI